MQKTITPDVINVLLPSSINGIAEQKSKIGDYSCSFSYELLTSCMPFDKSEFCFLIYQGEGQYLTRWLQLWLLNKIMALRMFIHCNAPYKSRWYAYL